MRKPCFDDRIFLDIDSAFDNNSTLNAQKEQILGKTIFTKKTFRIYKLLLILKRYFDERTSSV